MQPGFPKQALLHVRGTRGVSRATRSSAGHMGGDMIRSALCLLGVIAAGAAQAGEFGPLQAQSIALGDVKGVAYYTVGESGYEVVATLASGETGTPMRFVATLTPGQRMLLSVPGSANERASEIEIARRGDAMIVSEPATGMTATMR